MDSTSSVPARRHRPDYWLLILTSILLVTGLVVVYSISPGLAASENISQNYFVTKQLIDVGLGVVGFILASQIPLRVWLRYATPLIALAILGSLAVMVTPLNALYPAHRWIRIGSFSFQIAELIKLAVIIWLARFLTEHLNAGRLNNFKDTFKPLLIILLIVGVVMAKFQSDLGSAAVVVMVLAMMAYSAGVALKKLGLFVGAILLFGVLAISSSAYRRQRVTTFLHPESNCQGAGYQACQALISVGSGGIFGLGLGYSVQAYGYQPEPSNDSIFAIIGEKFGFIGSLLLVSLYGFFIARLVRIAQKTVDMFSRLIVVGVLAWISTQMVINIGAMIGLLPLKGITLPLISQGGTSIIFLTAALGLVFQISRYTSYDVAEPKTTRPFDSRPSDSANGRRLGRSHRPYLVARPRT